MQTLMAPPIQTPRSSWIDAGLKMLAAAGPDAVRIELLAKALGVTRGGFYWHFDSRRALLDEMLDTWERRSTDEVLERVEGQGGDHEEKMSRAGLLTFSRQLLRIDLAVRDWARRDPAVAKRLRRVDNRRMAYLRKQMRHFGDNAADIEARCILAFSLAIGHHLIAADHGTHARRDVVAHAVRLVLGTRRANGQIDR
jgi:AcrR family transcriptional regulator